MRNCAYVIICALESKVVLSFTETSVPETTTALLLLYRHLGNKVKAAPHSTTRNLCANMHKPEDNKLEYKKLLQITAAQFYFK